MTVWPIEVGIVAAGAWPSRWSERCGIRVPPVQPGSVWVHGASLGESTVARRLVERLQPAFCTADTASGRGLADWIRPFDHPWTLAPLWAEARPRLVVFVEGAWWPALARLARRSGVPVVVVGARMTRWKPLVHRLLGWPDAVLARDEEAAAAFAPHTAVLGISGLLKGFDSRPNPLVFEGDFFVGVCTHPGDEEAWLAAVGEVAPEATVVLAPRDITRVASLCGRFPTARLRTELEGAVPRGTVVLLDTLGELGAVLQGATGAFVGGTFSASIGGHSPLEARTAGVPVVHGPQTASNAPGFVGTFQADTPAGLAEALRSALAAPVAPVDDPLEQVVSTLQRFSTPAPEASPRPWARHFTRLRRTPRRVAGRVWAVGSANARGAGKTTLCDRVARGLMERGLQIGIVTRGVGATVRFGDSEQHGADAAYLGDEGAWLALRGHRVVAAPWEVGVQHLGDVDIVLLEDGLGVEGPRVRLATVDCRYPTARGPFPMGEARPTGGVDVCVAVRSSSTFPAPAGTLLGHFRPTPWSDRWTGAAVAFGGIGRPVDFFDGLDVQAVRAFPDHHRYTRQDRMDLQRWAAGRTLLTTTRDAVRLPSRFPCIHRSVTLDVPGLDLGPLLERT